jgi:glycosyltransferase involved in cell wall biosynthesis
MLRIAHVTATFPPYRGGTGNVCFHHARELARRGHTVHVLTAAAPDAPPREERDGFTVRRLAPLLRAGNAPLLPGLLPALRGFDLIHLHYPFFGGELTTLAAQLFATPLVITYHQDVHIAGAMGMVAEALRYSVGRWTLRSATRLLFTSCDYGQASYVRPMLRGRQHRVGELPNGVDIRRFTPGPRPLALRERYALAPSERVALLVAGLDRAHAFKGVEVFLRAVRELPQLRGLVVGDGDLRASYEQIARSLGVTARVSFAGRVAEEELPDYYRLADVTVLPSTTMGEAFGLVLVESLASATPVVASDLPGVRTVVDNGRDGLLAPPGDATALAAAIGRVLGNETIRLAMGRHGRARIEARYSWERIGDRLEAIYAEVLGERGGHHRNAADAHPDHMHRGASPRNAVIADHASNVRANLVFAPNEGNARASQSSAPIVAPDDGNARASQSSAPIVAPDDGNARASQGMAGMAGMAGEHEVRPYERGGQ